MVDVPAPHGHIMKGSNIVMDRNRYRAHYQSGREETEGCQKKALVSRFQEPPLIHILQMTVGNDCGEAAENRRNQNRQNPKTPMSPEHLSRSWHANRKPGGTKHYRWPKRSGMGRLKYVSVTISRGSFSKVHAVTTAERDSHNDLLRCRGGVAFHQTRDLPENSASVHSVAPVGGAHERRLGTPGWFGASFSANASSSCVGPHGPISRSVSGEHIHGDKPVG